MEIGILLKISVPLHMEGVYGLGEWCNMDLEQNKATVAQLGVKDIDEVLEKGQVIFAQDNNTGKIHPINFQDFVNGFNKWANDHLKPLEYDTYEGLITGTVSIDDIDYVLQYVIFGEIRYTGAQRWKEEEDE